MSFLVAFETQVAIRVFLLFGVGQFVFRVVDPLSLGLGGGRSVPLFVLFLRTVAGLQPLKSLIGLDGRSTEIGEGPGLVIGHSPDDLLLQASLAEREFGEVVDDPSFDKRLFELVDEDTGAGGLFNVSIEETILRLLSRVGVLESFIEFGHEGIPSGEVGGLWDLPDEFELILHPLLGPSSHEAKREPNLLFVVHWTKNEVIPALCKEYGSLGGIPLELVGHVRFNAVLTLRSGRWCWCWCGYGPLESLDELLHHCSHVWLGWSAW